MFGLALRDGQIVSNLRRAGETLPRFGEELDGAFVLFQRPEKKLGQMQVRTGSTGIDEQTLLVVCGRFCKNTFRFFDLLSSLQSTPGVVQQSGKQIVRLIFFRMLLDDFLEHLHCFVALIG